MADNTNIEWATHTFNPWEGCTKVGPGCDHCYAEVRNARYAGSNSVNWGPGAPRRRTSVANWKNPLRWNANAAEFFSQHGHRQRVFCASLADVFDNEVDPQWRIDLFELIKATPNLDWLLLTKRIDNVSRMVELTGLPKNVWLGATICDQEEADRDIPKLIAINAKVRFLSMEPLLGPVSLRWMNAFPENAPNTALNPHNPEGVTNHLDGLRRLDWIIVGGESGPHARPMHPHWAQTIRDQCAAAGVPFLFKQWGEYKPVGRKELNVFGKPTQGYIHPSMKYGELPYKKNGGIPSDDELEALSCAYVAKVGKKAAGRLLDGITHTEFPRVGV